MYAVSHNDYDEKIEIERSGDWHFGGPIDEILYRAILIRGGSSMLMDAKRIREWNMPVVT